MKKFYFFLLAMLFSVVAFAYDAEIEGIYYNLDDRNKTAEVTKGSYTQTEITIPSKVTYNSVEYSVTSIGRYAFHYCSSLTSITIPNSVTSIGESAFSHCSSLTSITIPNSVTSIGEYAFAGCPKLTNMVVESENRVYDSRDNCNAIIETASNTLIQGCKNTIIPNSVTSIGEYAFSDCSSLTSIEIPNSVTSIGESAFSYCSSLTSITIPSSVTSIGEYAFCDCSSLTSITIPNSVTSIGEIAFYHCTSLTSITIPNSVTYIGGAAFAGCPKLTNMVVESENRVYDSRDNCNAIIETASNTLIQGCKNTIIPNSVTSIGESAFSECSSLTSIEIPNSVTSIGEGAFSYCSSLTSITIPSSVTSIGEYAFYYCSSLTSIEIPNSVTSIGDEAFSHCKSLTSIIMQSATPPTIVEETFYEVSRGVEIRVPCGSINSYKTAEYWSEFTNYEEVPSTTITINVNDETMGFATVTKRNTCDDDVAQVQAQALPGYKFVRWSDGSTENPRIIVVTEDIKLSATFELDETTLIEKTQITSANVYSRNGILHVEGAETDYYVLDMAGRLIYSGRDTELQLPRGVYVVNVGGEVQKVVL